MFAFNVYNFFLLAIPSTYPPLNPPIVEDTATGATAAGAIGGSSLPPLVSHDGGG